MVGPQQAAGGRKSPSAASFEPLQVQAAIAALFAQVSELQVVAADARRKADLYLRDFEHSEAAVPVALELLAGRVGALAPEAAELLASILRRRLQRGPRRPPGAADAHHEELLRTAALLFEHRSASAASARAAEQLLRGAVDVWLHLGALPLEALLQDAAEADQTKAGLALLCLKVLPEEATDNRLRLHPAARPNLLLELTSAASGVLASVSKLEHASPSTRLSVAEAWLRSLGGGASAELLQGLEASALLPSAAALFSLGGPPEAAVAAEFLEALLAASKTAVAVPEQLTRALLELFAALRPTHDEGRHMLCGLVASAASSWCGFYVAAGAGAGFGPGLPRSDVGGFGLGLGGGGAAWRPPAQEWVSLLEAVTACARWGHVAAGATLQAWREVWQKAGKVGARPAYVVVLVRALSGLRAASVYPAEYEDWTLEAQEDFTTYRRELREALRDLTEDDSLCGLLVQQIHADVAERSVGAPWQLLEEPLHALAALAKPALRRARAGTACAASEGAAWASVAAATELLAAFAAEEGPLAFFRSCHRQLLGSFLSCASAFAPALSLRHPGSGAGCSLAQRALTIARASLVMPAEIAEGPGAAYPLKAKEDHLGCLCLLNLCSSCSTQLPRAASELGSELREHVVASASAAACGGAGPAAARPLTAPSCLVLAQAAALAAACCAEESRRLLADCLELVRSMAPTGAELALAATAAVVDRCGERQAAALAAAMEPSWAGLSDPQLDVKALATLLERLAKHLPQRGMVPLAHLTTGIFALRPRAQAAMLGVVAAVVHRAATAQGPADGDAGALQALAAELVHGAVDRLAAELDTDGRLLLRLQHLTEPGVWSPGAEAERRAEASPAVSPHERELIEALADLVHVVGKEAPSIVADGSERGARIITFALHAATSLVAAPQEGPPAKTLAFLSHVWSNPSDCMQVQVRNALAVHVAVGGGGGAGGGGGGLGDDDGGPWTLGALLLRSVMKALLGQMPHNALAVLVPAAHAVFQHGAPAVEPWLVRAVAGGGFPAPSTKVEAKRRFVQELLELHSDAQAFKQALKRFCGGKKKTAGRTA